MKTLLKGRQRRFLIVLTAKYFQQENRHKEKENIDPLNKCFKDYQQLLHK